MEEPMNHTAKKLLESYQMYAVGLQISEHTDICEENTVHASKYGQWNGRE
jgi:hypothetical protein